MSNEKLETVRAIADAFSNRDFDRPLGHFHTEVELNPGIVAFDVRTRYRGPEEVREFFETISAEWDEYTMEPEEMIEADDGRVLAIERWRTRLKDGAELDTQIIDLYEFRDGLIVRVDGFRDKAAAFEAAGLRY